MEFKLKCYFKNKPSPRTSNVWIQIAKRNFFPSERLNAYATRDAKNSTKPNAITIRRFGPSGSFKNVKNALEHIRDVTPKTMRVVFFGVKFISP